MRILKIKTGDTQPISITLLDAETEEPINISGATVKFIMVTADNARTVIVNKAAAVLEDAVNGIVKYNFAADDVKTPGEYFGYFQITYSGGKIQTVPADDELKIIILDDWV